jgi:RNA polymerase sigma-70 factor (ECF subfamily)
VVTGPPEEPDWEELYTESFPRVYRAVLATVRDREVAKDALQHAFLEGLRRPPPRDQNLAGWLFRVAVRNARREPRLLPLVGLGARETNDPTDELLNRLEAGRLLSLLTRRQREIVVAHYYLGLTHAETAQLFGVQPGTVSATIAQALGRIRKGDSHA